jgi:hypothetical protein
VSVPQVSNRVDCLQWTAIGDRGLSAGAVSELDFPDGTYDLGGTYLVIDTITWAATNSTNVGVATLQVQIGNTPIFYASMGLGSSTAGLGSADTKEFLFPNGLPCIEPPYTGTNTINVKAGQPGVGVRLLTGGPSGCINRLSVTYHYRRWNG